MWFGIAIIFMLASVGAILSLKEHLEKVFSGKDYEEKAKSAINTLLAGFGILAISIPLILLNGIGIFGIIIAVALIYSGWNKLKGLLPENYIKDTIELIKNRLKLSGFFAALALICFAIASETSAGAIQYSSDIYVNKQGWVRSGPGGQKIGYSIEDETYRTYKKKGDWYYAKGRYLKIINGDFNNTGISKGYFWIGGSLVTVTSEE